MHWQHRGCTIGCGCVIRHGSFVYLRRSRPTLCWRGTSISLVRPPTHTELRVFPFGLEAERLEALEAQIMQTFLHTSHLRKLCWTRDGSLNDRMVRTMFDCLDQLHTLEITGNSRLWSPALLAEKLPRSLRHLRILLPDRAVAQHLAAMVERCAANLEGLFLLSMVCIRANQNTSEITDAVLLQVAAHVPAMEHLTLVGCKGVQGEGVKALVQSGTMTHLALEGITLSPPLLRTLATATSRLRSLTLTHPRRADEVAAFYASLTAMVTACDHLEELTLYAPRNAGQREAGRARPQTAPAPVAPNQGETGLVLVATPPDPTPSLDTEFVRRLVFSPASYTLTKLAVYEIQVSVQQLQLLALSRLADSVIHVALHLYEDQHTAIAFYLAKFKQLTTLHLASSESSSLYYTPAQLLALARQCSGSLTTIGFRNRVWNIGLEKGERILTRYDMAAGVYPETLLVVRTIA